MKNKRLDVFSLCVTGVFAALVAVLSQIMIPLPTGVPVTMQTFAVLLAGVALGAKRGGAAVGVYVLLGAVGAPVFAGFTGGLGVVFGPTGGFILAFPVMAYLAGLGASRGAGRLVVGIVLAFAADYTAGVLMYCAVTGGGFAAGVMACVVPFLPADVVKAVLAVAVGLRCRSLLKLSATFPPK